MCISALLAIAPALAQAEIRFQQCEWGGAVPQVCQGDRWITGSASLPHAAFREGDFVPTRFVIDTESPTQRTVLSGHTYTIIIGYNATQQNGLHAYDYLGTYNASRRNPLPNHPNQPAIQPCSGVADTEGSFACGPGPHFHTPSMAPVPVDVRSTNLRNSPVGAGGHFSAWGATLADEGSDAPHFVDCPQSSPATAVINQATRGTVERCIALTFRVAGAPSTTPHGVVIAWGAHIATAADWGNRAAALIVTGDDFHQRVVNRASNGFVVTGNRTLTAGVVPAPTLTTSLNHGAIHADGTVIETAHLTPRNPTPQGDVRFFVCYSANQLPPGGCPEGSGSAGHDEPVTIGPGGTAALVYPPENKPPEGGLSPGFYCFRAEYKPADSSLYQPITHTNGILSRGAGSNGECFTVELSTLEVEKVCNPPTDQGHFEVHIRGLEGDFDKPVTCNGTTGVFDVPPGTYEVSETALPGNHTYSPTTFGADCGMPVSAIPGQVMVGEGDSKTCEVVNSRAALGGLMVNKLCVPTTRGRFTILISSNGRTRRSANRRCGEGTGQLLLPPGQYKVSERAGIGTSLGHYTTVIGGPNCAADGSVTVIDGGNAICTITNEQKSATLTVKKLCVPKRDDGHFAITIDGATPANGTVACGGTVGPIPITPGRHTVAERGARGTDIAAYEKVVGGDCEVGGHVNIAPGQAATCEISNVRHSQERHVAELTLVKFCAPQTDSGLFNLRADDEIEKDQPCGGKVGPVALQPGNYHALVGETAGSGTSLSDYRSVIGGACRADGSIRLTAGESATCTITNVRRGQPTAVLSVRKVCRPADDPGRFVLDINEQSFRGMRCGQSTGRLTLATGTHLVGELVVPPGLANNYRIAFGGDCAANGAITLRAHQHATCSVTNTRIHVRHAAVRPRPPKPPPPVVTG